MEIYRIFQCSDGKITEIAFVASKQSTRKYLQVCYDNLQSDSVFYFASHIYVEE